MKLQESGEMYLETILVLSERIQHVRSIDVCEELGYSKPSVSRAMSILRNNGYVVMDNNGFLLLTDAGREIAEIIYSRHNILSAFLEKIGVDEKTAAEDACRIEHVISDETMAVIKTYMDGEK